MQAQELKIADFTYHLPDEKIAQHPLKERDKSKLLVYKNGEITASVFNKLPAILISTEAILYILAYKLK